VLLAQYEYGLSLVRRKRRLYLHRQNRRLIPKQRRSIKLNPFPAKGHQQAVRDFGGPVGRNKNLVAIAKTIQETNTLLVGLINGMSGPMASSAACSATGLGQAGMVFPSRPCRMGDEIHPPSLASLHEEWSGALD
jgi:hypothetical protein